MISGVAVSLNGKKSTKEPLQRCNYTNTPLFVKGVKNYRRSA